MWRRGRCLRLLRLLLSRRRGPGARLHCRLSRGVVCEVGVVSRLPTGRVNRMYRLFSILSRLSLIFSFMAACSCVKRWNSDFMIRMSLSRSRRRILMSLVLECRISVSINSSSFSSFLSPSASFISASPSWSGFLPSLESLSFFSSLPSLSISSRSSSVDMMAVMWAARDRDSRCKA